MNAGYVHHDGVPITHMNLVVNKHFRLKVVSQQDMHSGQKWTWRLYLHLEVRIFT